MSEDGVLLLERDDQGLYEMTIPLSSFRLDWQALVLVTDALRKIVVDGKGPAIYVIRIEDEECSDDT